ncbi:MAG: FMN-binding negative transcriptional regulator [Tardiphaga sp.]|nr:FMN-binding negative transcriptional regulator [Tardiphaga sp.]
MYTSPAFKPDRAAALGGAAARGFGAARAWDGRKPIAAAPPFRVDCSRDGTPRLAFDLARHNPLVQLADGASSWMMAVNGDYAYVSAGWYVSPDQVPTWLYEPTQLNDMTTLEGTK